MNSAITKPDSNKQSKMIHWSSILKYRPTPTQRRIAFIGAIALSCLLYIIIYTHVPLFLWITGFYDDGLFMKLGQNLAEGNWLGPYNRFTLMKGPGYPAFLAVAFWLGIKISFMHALFHCLAVTVFAWVVLRISNSRLLAVAVFLITLWHPSMFVIGRLLRANIYAPQTILILAVFSYALFVTDQRAQRIKWGLLVGLFLGWYWLTREEGVWILPGIGFLLLFEWIRGNKKDYFKRIGELALPMAAVCLFIQFAFSFANWMAYDKFIGVDFKEKNFKATLKALQSVRVGEPIPYLPLSRAARERVYEVSPSFATLRDYLDPPSGSPWQYYCTSYPWTCGDMAGVLMWWAIRDAADHKGYYETATKASSFYGAIAKEVNAACHDGRLDCDEGWFSFLPVITRDQLRKIPETTSAVIQQLFDPKRFHPAYQRIQVKEKDYLGTLRFLNHPAHFSPAAIHKDDNPLRRNEGYWILIDGWYYNSKKGDEWFQTGFDCRDHSKPLFQVDRNGSRDIADHFNDIKAFRQRFLITVEYEKNCNLIFSNKNAGKLSLKMEELVQVASKSWKMGSGTLYVDSSKLHYFAPTSLNKEKVQVRRNDKNWVLIEGWYYDSKKGDEWFQTGFDCPDHSMPLLQVDRNGSRDVVENFNDIKASKQRFSITMEYQKNCNLVFSNKNAEKLSLKMEELVQVASKSWKMGSGTLYVDSATLNPYNSDVRIRTSYKIRSVVYEWYKAGFPLLIWIGFLSFLGGIPLMWKKRTWPVLFALAGACWILIAVRIIILVLIEISSFPAFEYHYLLPAYLLLCVAPILSIGGVMSITWNKNNPGP